MSASVIVGNSKIDQYIVEQQARESKLLKIREFVAGSDLPAGAKFCGYLIHMLDTDDYLGPVKAGRDMTVRAYCPGPGHAMRFAMFGKAVETARDLPRLARVCALFDVGDKWYVATDDYEAH